MSSKKTRDDAYYKTEAVKELRYHYKYLKYSAACSVNRI